MPEPEEEDKHEPWQTARRRYAVARNPLAILMAVNGPRSRLGGMPTAKLSEWERVLRIALKRERAKGVSRHWSYDLNRHIGIKTALREVAAHLDARAATGPQKVKSRD